MVRTSAIAAACIVALLPAAARAQANREYNIPPGSLSRALRLFMLQSDRQLLVVSDLVGRRASPGFAGRGVDTAVLARLLEGTGLTFRPANGDILLVVRAPEASPRPAPPRAGPRPLPPPRPEPPLVEVNGIVVTGARQLESIERAALSVTAATQRRLDQQGVRIFGDLIGVVPAVSFSQTSPGVANVAIRGIQNSPGANTAPTTGFYLDDTPLHKRNTAGYLNGNGTALPPLFDLERVEVFRGPRGTSQGASSEGGAMRYVTTAPDLSRSSAYVRAEASLMKDGDGSYDVGVAVGGPIVTDKLGFRASVFVRKLGGYIDYVDPFSGAERIRNANSGSTRVARIAVAFAPDDRFKATLAYFTSIERSDSNQNAFTLDTIKTAIVERPVCIAAGALTPATRTYPGVVACDRPDATYVRPGGTFGPYALEPYDLVTVAGLAPSKTVIQAPTLTLDYDFGRARLKAVTSYVRDQNALYSQALTNELNQREGLYDYAGAPASTAYPAGGAFTRGLPWAYATAGMGPDGPPYFGYADVRNVRRGFVQEVRIAADPDVRPVSWLAGVYFANDRVSTRWRNSGGEAISRDLYGLTTEQRYGVPMLRDPDTGEPILYALQAYRAKDVEVAAFGEADLWLTQRLKLTLGARLSRIDFDFHGQVYAGSSGVAFPPLTRDASLSQTPLTPKFGLQYEVGDGGMLYAVASKGFRAGGVNPTPPPATCDAVLGRFGLSTRDVPATYGSDSLWSYEAGAKARLFGGKLRLNGDFYRIDLSDIQSPVNFLGCGTDYVVNAGSARSRGFEIEAQTAVTNGFSASVSIGYTDARHLSTVPLPAAPGFTPLLATARGQRFAIPPWQVSLGARYERSVSSRTRFYARGDWRWTSEFRASPPPGVQGYAPDAARGGAVSKLNLRTGFEMGDFDLNLFVNNLTNARGGTANGGRGGCTPEGGAACTTYTLYNPFMTTTWGSPRQVGLQIAYRN